MKQCIICEYENLILCGFVIVFCLLALCGFFEERENGLYKFRTGRFASAILTLLVSNIIIFSLVINDTRQIFMEGFHTAETSALRARALQVYSLQNLSEFFPQILNPQTKACYKSGLSNYVEEQWNVSFRDGLRTRNPTLCQKNPSLCPDRQEDYYDAIRPQTNPYHIFLRDFSTIGYVLGSAWIAAAGSYITLRELFQKPDDKGQIPPLPSSAVLDDYHGHLNNCASYHPQPWSVLDGQLLQTPTMFCVGACP